MEYRELCARNLSAAIREAENAKLAARWPSVSSNEDVDELTGDLIERACELLERARQRVMPPPAAPPVPPLPPAAKPPKGPEPTSAPVASSPKPPSKSAPAAAPAP